MIQPMMINPDMGNSKPKYLVSIKQANNGFIVEVEQEMYPQRPLNAEEAQRKIANFMRNVGERIEGGQDNLLNNILDKAIDEENENEIQILGFHVFYKYSELTAFLSFVYANDDKPDTQRVDPNPKKPKKK
jgi:hypothetical protein